MDYSIFSFPEASNEYIYVPGSKIILSAPHAYDHYRDGVIKQGELGTDKIAKLLAEELGLGYIATTGVQSGDPNWDTQHPFRDEILNIVADYNYLVDLHFMLPRKVDLNIGRGVDFTTNSILSENIFKIFESHEYRVAVNWPFSAKGPTLTSLAQRAGLPALQLEINYDSFKVEDKGIERLVELLSGAFTQTIGRVV